MKNLILLLVFCLAVPLLGSCGITEPDRQVFVICMAIDLAEDGQFSLTLQAPEGKAAGGETSGGGEAYRIFGGTSDDLAHALHVLETTLPFPANFSQLRVCFLSTELLTQYSLTEIAKTLFRYPSIRSSAHMLVVEGSAKEVLKAQKSSFSMRLSIHLDTLLNNLISKGYSPKGSLSTCMQYLGSGRYDPLLGLAAINPALEGEPKQPSTGGAPESNEGGSGSSGGSGGNEKDQGSQSVFSKSIPTLDMTDVAGLALTEGGDPVEIMGAAALREGKVVGFLSPRECVIFHHLKTKGRLQCAIQGENLQLQVLLRPEDVNDTVVNEGTALLQKLQALGSDPFGFGNASTRSFWTLGEWEAYGFTNRYPGADVYVGL